MKKGNGCQCIVQSIQLDKLAPLKETVSPRTATTQENEEYDEEMIAC